MVVATPFCWAKVRLLDPVDNPSVEKKPEFLSLVTIFPSASDVATTAQIVYGKLGLGEAVMKSLDPSNRTAGCPPIAFT